MSTRLAALTLFALVAGTLAGPPAYAGDPTLIGWWKLDDGAGTTALDSSGSGHDGTIRNPNGGLGAGGSVWVNDPERGMVISFSGTDGSGACVVTGVTLPAMTLSNSFTWIFWAKQPAAQATNNDTILGNRYGGTSSPLQFIKFTPTRFECYNDDGAYLNGINYTSIPSDVWVHHALVKDGASQTYYRDGVPILTNTMTKTVAPNPFYMGADAFSGVAEAWQGYLSDVRLYERALTETEVRGVMAGKGPNAELAGDPAPEDGATDVPQDAILGWTSGEFAAAHDVYLGMDFADVNEADRGDPRGVLAGQGQAAAEYTPEGLLEFGQTYYWRVDEVNAAPDNTIFEGDVWSFTVEPFAYPLACVTATASGSQPTMGPQNAVCGVGLNADDQHSTDATQMWTGSTLPAWIQFELDQVYKLHELWVWNSNQVVESFLGLGAKDVTIEYSLDGATWTVLEGVPPFNRAPGAPGYTANTIVDLGGITARFVKLTINSNWGGIAKQSGLSEVRFYYVPVQAFNPQPADAATDVSVETDLDWRPGRGSTSHVLYLGTDAEAVAAGTVAGETLSDHGYTPTDLLLETEYFWKVDEVGDAGTVAGEVWSFTTEQYLVVEDFESYNDDVDAETTVWHAWIDGLTDGRSGSQVGYDLSPFAEKTIVNSGGQSMPFKYDNTSFAFSEATLTFDTPQDWTARGVTTLSVHFAGTAGNTGQLYLKINNTKVLYDGDAADLARTGWQAWNIDLSTVGNVSSVRSLTVGVEGTGAGGMLYIDDIRLSAKPLTFTTPVEPPAASLIGRWAFDGTVQDSSGKGRNGTANGGPTYVAGVDGQALHLDGIDDFIVVGSVGISGAAPRTISGWVKADTTTITDWTNIFGFTSSTAANALSFDMNKRGGANQYCIHAYGWERNIMAIDLEWHHLAATYDGTTVAWYGDGQFVAGEAWTLNTQDNVQMGKRGHAAGGNFPGSLDEIRIYDAALSAEEIAWLAGRRQPIHNPL